VKYRRLVERAYRRRAERRAKLLLIFAERGWNRPHEMGLLIVCILGGFLGLIFGGGTSSVVQQAFPYPLNLVWFLGIGLGSAVAYGGILSRTSLGLEVERAGLLALTGWLLAFPVMGLGILAIPGSLNVSVFIGSFGLCNIVRAFWISVDLHELDVLITTAERQRLKDDENGGAE
jgi:hypothetical protein